MKKKRYSVYNKKTDMPVYIYGTAEQCAKAMGIKTASFYATHSKIKRGVWTHRHWEIIEEDEVDLDE
jgi:hypothetical protein